MKIASMAGRVAVTPFPDMSVKTSLTGTGAVRVARIENRVALVALTAVADGPLGISKGDTVYVRSANFTSPWAKEVHENIAGLTPFILAPEGAIEMVLYGEASANR